VRKGTTGVTQVLDEPGLTGHVTAAAGEGFGQGAHQDSEHGYRAECLRESLHAIFTGSARHLHADAGLLGNGGEGIAVSCGL